MKPTTTPSAMPTTRDVISFTNAQYPPKYLVGVIVALQPATTEFDVRACLSVSPEGSHVVAFVPTGSTGVSASDQTATLISELEELRERRDVLQQDVTASYARIDDLDAQIASLQAALMPTAEEGPALAAPPETNQKGLARAAEVEKADKGLLEARKGLQRSLKTAVADWNKLKTVGVPSASASKPGAEVARIVKGPPPPREVIDLVEAALSILNSKSAGTTFRSAQPTLPVAAKKCSMLKPDHVDPAQLKKAEACLAQYTSTTLAKKTTPAALVPLYTWIKAMSASVKTRQTPQQGASADETPVARKSASPDPIKPPTHEVKSKQAELHKLAQERKEHMDYVELAEEELEAMNGLVRETEAAVAAAASPARHMTQTHTMRISRSQVIAVLPRDDRTLLAVEKAALMAPGTAVALPRETVACILGQTPERQASTTSSMPLSSPSVSLDRSRASSPKVTEQKTAMAASSGPLFGTPQRSSLNMLDSGDVKPPMDDERVRLNARIQELESNLELALHKNPAQAEVQLLREELKAKSADLDRLTEERDKLLREKRERRRGSSMLQGRARAESESRDAPLNGTASDAMERYGAAVEEAGRDATSRPRVDRHVAEELEDQLNAAHQRIRELEKQQAAVAAASATAAANTSAIPAVSSAQEDTSGRQPFPPVGILSQTLSNKMGISDEHDVVSLQSGGLGLDWTVSEQAADADRLSPVANTSRGTAVSPAPLHGSASFVSPDVQQEFEARLSALREELEQQKKVTMVTEERLNMALHSQQEAQRVSKDQKKELKTVWKRLEDAESALEKERFDALMAARRQTMLDEMSHVSVSPSLPNAMGSPSVSNVMPMEELHSGVVPTSRSTATTPKTNVNATKPHAQSISDSATNVLEINQSVADRSSPSLEMPVSDPLHPGQSMTTPWHGVDSASRRLSASGGRAVSISGISGRFDGRSVSLATPLLSNAPVEHMTPVELRHEVRALRGEVERLQSSERRLMTELSDMHAKQKEERRQRREARRARMTMMSMMESAVSAALAPSVEDDTHKLISNARSETESIRSGNPSRSGYRA